MTFRNFCLAGFAMLISVQAYAAGVELFGVPLANADRSQVRVALKNNGLQATREDDAYWVDLYDPSGKLDEASELSFGYEHKSAKFAVANYTFESFMDTDQVKRIVGRVSQKYGKPARVNGSWGLGNVSAIWNMPDGIEIEVSRGWPSTTTTLSYRHRARYAAMRGEMQASQQNQERAKASRQNNAF